MPATAEQTEPKCNPAVERLLADRRPWSAAVVEDEDYALVGLDILKLAGREWKWRGVAYLIPDLSSQARCWHVAFHDHMRGEVNGTKKPMTPLGVSLFFQVAMPFEFDALVWRPEDNFRPSEFNPFFPKPKWAA